MRRVERFSRRTASRERVEEKLDFGSEALHNGHLLNFFVEDPVRKSDALPSVRVNPRPARRVREVCGSLGIQPSMAVGGFLEPRIPSCTQLDLESDAGFMASALESLASPEVQEAFKRLGENYKPREYPEAESV